MFNVTVSVDALIPQLQGLAWQYGAEIRTLIYDQMRLACNDLIKRTPPSKALLGTGSYGTDWKIGKNWVTGDINLVLQAWDKPEALEWIYHAFGNQVPESVVLSNSSGDSARMRGWHEAFRNKRTGRVKYKSSRAKVGPFELGTGMHVPRRALEKYIQERHKRVGVLKSGWVPGARVFAVLGGGRAVVPSWVARHDGNGVTRTSMDRMGNGYCEAENTVRYAKDHSLLQRLIDFEMQVRREDLRRWAPIRMDQVVRRWNRMQGARLLPAWKG